MDVRLGKGPLGVRRKIRWEEWQGTVYRTIIYLCIHWEKEHLIRVVFEGDDSILGSMLNLHSLADQIELHGLEWWSRLGFRMKLNISRHRECGHLLDIQFFLVT